MLIDGSMNLRPEWIQNLKKFILGSNERNCPNDVSRLLFWQLVSFEKFYS